MADRITISNFSLRYSGSGPSVLDSLSMVIPGGTCCAIVGPTGAGKTSFLHCLAGTLRKHHPESVAAGRIQIGSKTYEGLSPQILFPTVGLVLQDPYVQLSGVRDTVYDEVLFTLENIGGLKENPEQTIIPLLHDLGIEHLAKRKPTSLSGGETQRVALATTLVARPPVLLLDEPTTALDLNAQDRLRRILRGVKGNSTIVLTDTQLDFALGLCDQVVVLDRGRITFDGQPLELLKRLHEFSASVVSEGWSGLERFIEALDSESTGRRTRIAKLLGIS
jgi:energy-coupling factor transporter ATP-binding protein EcfA2